LISTAALLAACLVFSPLPAISPLFVLVLVVSCFVFSFLGVLVALLAKSHQDMSVFMSLVILPMTFLSGTFFSLSQLPEPVRVVLSLLPLTHSSQCLRAATLGQPFPWISLLVLVGFGAAFFWACMIVLKRTSL